MFPNRIIQTDPPYAILTFSEQMIFPGHTFKIQAVEANPRLLSKTWNKDFTKIAEQWLIKPWKEKAHTECVTDLDKFNLVKLDYWNLVLG